MRCTHRTWAIAVAGASTTKTNTLAETNTLKSARMRTERADIPAIPKTRIPKIGTAKRIAAGAGFLR